ncbi:MAG: rod shape-determining protein MreC [Clostridiales bacterium]|nr:rod shape-determining protein MreC [Clostridiales bacterium]
MKKLWKQKPWLIALVAVALFFVLAGLTSGTRKASTAENLFAAAAQPAQGFVGRVTDAVSDFFLRVFSPNALGAENAQLRARAEEAERKALLYEAVARENARLSELLDYTSPYANMRFIAASVTARSANAFVDTLTIRAGSQQGVRERMAVVCENGLVGRVVEVGLSWSKVRTIQNENMRIPVQIERTRDEAMLGGLVYHQGLFLGFQLDFLPEDADLRVGDVILTSGEGDSFPKGLVVGTVISVTQENGVHLATVSSRVDFIRLEEVLVVREVEEPNP